MRVKVILIGLVLVTMASVSVATASVFTSNSNRCAQLSSQYETQLKMAWAGAVDVAQARATYEHVCGSADTIATADAELAYAQTYRAYQACTSAESAQRMIEGGPVRPSTCIPPSTSH